MTETTQLTETLRHQTLDLVKQGQELTLQAVTAWSDALGRFIPAEARTRVSTGIQADALIDQAFGFTTDLLAAQQEFAHDLLSAIVPQTEGGATRVDGPKAKPAAKTTA
jgi:hypothetical protein